MTIYKKDTTGKIRQLRVTTLWANLIQISWVVGWKLITAQKICKAKNVWKVNETTPSEQAIKQAEALIDKKLTEWYYKTIKEAENEVIVLPMLAKTYKNEKHKIDWEWPVFVQPKLDWMRCLAFIDNNWDVKLRSRKWKLIETMDHIKEEIKLFWLTNCVLDWELYCHWESFQENMKMIKKYREWQSEQINYHVYDSISKKTFFDRIPDLKLSQIVIPVTTIRIEWEDELIKHHKTFLSQWYEWTMIRHSNEWYKTNWRSSQLLKYKDFIDEAYKVVDVIPSEARPTQAVLVCKSDKWTFKASLKFSHEEREQILKDREKIIWQTAEIRFFEYTDDWLPRFPVAVGFRIDK